MLRGEIMSKKEFDVLAQQFNACKNDRKRWEIILANKDCFYLLLDNNSTVICFNDLKTTGLTQEEYNNLMDLDTLDEDIGDKSGLFTLLNLLEVAANRV